MQAKPLQTCRFAHATKTWSSCKRHRPSPRQDLRCIVQENFVNNSSGQRSPIYKRPPFDHHASDFSRRQPFAYCLQIGATIHTRSRNLFYLNSMFLKLLLLSLFCERAENQHIVICSLRDTGIKRQPQMRIDNQTQQRTPARKPASVSKQWIIGDYSS